MGEDSHHWFLLTDEELESRIWIDAGSSPSSIWVDGPGFYSIPYPPLLDWTITGNGVVVWGINREYRLTRYDVVNDSWMQIVFERTPVPFTSQDRHRYIEAELADYPAERRASRETALLRMPYPDHYPWFTGIWGDDEGNIWVCRYIERYWQPRPEGYRYELFNARGEWQGIVGTPRLFSVIRGGYAYVSGWEEYPTIERYRMIRNR
jgi:hypothetical protein